MRAELLPPSAAALQSALLSHGWEGVLASEAAAGLEPAAVHLTGVPEDLLPALVAAGPRLGWALATGPDWVLLLAPRSQLAVCATPWRLPPGVAPFAEVIARALPATPDAVWLAGRHRLGLERPTLVGVLNLTPDSFSDGGAIATVADALAHVERLLAGGAAMVDLGGQSTRPGATRIAETEECARVLPALEAIRARWPDLPLSVDTMWSSVAAAALARGADVINDVSGGRADPDLLAVVARHGGGLVLMHSRGGPEALASYAEATYRDVTVEVVGELRERVDQAVAAGVSPAAIAVDPGFGFAKRPEQNLQVANRLGSLTALGRPIWVGPSRKRFLGVVTGRPVGDRDRGTAAIAALLVARGARFIRVHDPAAVRDALAVLQAVDEERLPPGAAS